MNGMATQILILGSWIYITQTEWVPSSDQLELALKLIHTPFLNFNTGLNYLLHKTLT